MELQNVNPMFPITIEGHTFEPKGLLWSLTNINKVLPKLTKPPAQWRGREREYFERCADLHIVHGDQGGTWATERATIAYAMACSLDFYVMVVDAFVAMRNDAVLSAHMASLALVEKDRLLSANMPKADTLMHKANTIGLSWAEACRTAGIINTGLAKTYLAFKGRFVYKEHSTESRRVLEPKPSGFSYGFFKRCSTNYGNFDGFRVTAKGLVWLEERAKEINDTCRRHIVEQRKNSRLKTAKAQKGTV
ncbi:hypothetical protein K5D34_19805 [Pseudomonas cichorii]|nr:hypothetical protein [Pseudomonas cichorii]MBX8511932.1 hypothetical protein [Pseudomonas cichorii]MBX8526682.1 hypothetical protein [Pseudomonas cichorii]